MEKKCPFCSSKMSKIVSPFGFEVKTPMIEIRIPNVEKYKCEGCGFVAEFEVKK